MHIKHNTAFCLFDKNSEGIQWAHYSALLTFHSIIYLTNNFISAHKELPHSFLTAALYRCVIIYVPIPSCADSLGVETNIWNFGIMVSGRG